VGDVTRRQQDLGGCQPLTGEGLVPRGLQPRLAERGGGLEPRQRTRAPVEPEAREPERDRARGDNADRSAGPDEGADLSRAGTEEGSSDSATGTGNEAPTGADDDLYLESPA